MEIGTKCPLPWWLLWLPLADPSLSSQQMNPFYTCIPGGLYPSRRIIVSGTILPNAQW